MLFNSMAFAIFLPINFILYWACPAKFRYLYLIAASYYFYGSMDAAYPLLLFYTTAVSYGLALFMDGRVRPRLQKTVFLTGLLALAWPLLFFKYIHALFPGLTATVHFMLPAGISFYTFQALGYFIDVYQGKYPAERRFGHYCLFLSFFPQLLSGPIGRGDRLLPQWNQCRPFDAAQASYGLKLMAVGYFKKLVIASLLAPTIDMVYNHPGRYAGLIFPIATVFFAIQIYCDFSGYTDIAIGCARLFGITLGDNFKSPYFSGSIREFWSRWHISLSSWFRDYVYIPLGGSRVKPLRQTLNLMATFLVSGLWHGAGCTYLAWGALHGFYRVLENGKNPFQRKKERHPVKETPPRKKWHRIKGKHPIKERHFIKGKHPIKERHLIKEMHSIKEIHSIKDKYSINCTKKDAGCKKCKCGAALRQISSTALTFFAVCIAWVFFRANSLRDAWRILSMSLHGITDFYNYVKTAVIFLDMDYGHMLYISIPLLFLAIYDYASLKTDVIAYISSRKAWKRYSVYILFLLAILLFSEKGVSTEFYYFQF